MMARTRTLSVRARISLSILVATALGLAAAGVASSLVQGERIRSAVDDQLLHTVSELTAIAEGKTSDAPPASVEQLLRLAMQQLVPTTNEGVVGFINDTPALVPPTNLPFRIDHDDALVERIVDEADDRNVVIGTAQTEAGALRYVIVPVRVANDPNTGLYVAAYDLDAELAAVADSFRSFSVVAIIAVLVVGAVAWFVAGSLLRPIRLLREAARGSRTTADLTRRVPVTGRDDVSELAEAINSMFDRLQESSLSQRQLLDDIRHELKTPITIIRGNLELLDSGSVEDVEKTKKVTIDELDRMSNLVADISLLAESGNPQFVTLSEVDLTEFTDDVWAKASALDPGRPWDFSAAEGRAVFDTGRITQAWLQLAENAVKYSTPGQPILLSSSVVAAGTEDWVDLSVHDNGPGVPEEFRSRIFERFQRIDTSTAADGTGLGLTIVSAIAEAHGGHVMLADAPGAGSVFTIRIPRDAAATGSIDNGRNQVGSITE